MMQSKCHTHLRTFKKLCFNNDCDFVRHYAQTYFESQLTHSNKILIYSLENDKNYNECTLSFALEVIYENL